MPAHSVNVTFRAIRRSVVFRRLLNDLDDSVSSIDFRTCLAAGESRVSDSSVARCNSVGAKDLCYS